MSEANEKKVHQGRNVKRFREMLGLKQEGLAMELGEGWTQRRVSLLEGKEELEPDLLERLAGVLKVPVEAIRHLDEEGAVNIIATNFTGPDRVPGSPSPFAVNPVEKWIAALEENKKLYERLLQAEREKVALLEKVLAKKQ